jgi:hypothetical protein
MEFAACPKFIINLIIFLGERFNFAYFGKGIDYARQNYTYLSVKFW